MPAPKICPSEIYELMCLCWHAEPESRPTFPMICETILNFWKKMKPNDTNDTLPVNRNYNYFNLIFLQSSKFKYSTILSELMLITSFLHFWNMTLPHNNFPNKKKKFFKIDYWDRTVQLQTSQDIVTTLSQQNS